ncbi:MAG TPA: hypothetical protein VMV19_17870 [Xanthobacteraceae bacterium]|nr:hypothetical protein [Xanthobacteraceae bacterium]
MSVVLPQERTDRRAMKIYVLLMLIGVIVSMSYIPIRRAKPTATPAPDSVPANG